MPSERCRHRHLKVIPKILIALKYFVSCIPEIRVSTSSTFLFQVFVFYLHLIFYKTFSIAMISFESGCGLEGYRIPFSFSFFPSRSSVHFLLSNGKPELAYFLSYFRDALHQDSIIWTPGRLLFERRNLKTKKAIKCTEI